ncbi:hypothetical protein [Nonomuraea sp. NPDC003804]|uniref:hypothetical protein n=1 Tax=Nonomuraea sp. NPDC003804 TaxID=3154547 RepID=UPI0033A60E3D
MADEGREADAPSGGPDLPRAEGDTADEGREADTPSGDADLPGPRAEGDTADEAREERAEPGEHSDVSPVDDRSADIVHEDDSAADPIEARRQAAEAAGHIDQDGRVPVEHSESGDRVRGWPHDDTGYAVREEDLDVLGIDSGQVEQWQRFEAPLGMNPEQYKEFTGSLLVALAADGIDPSQVDIRLQGSSAQFFSGPHKDFPRDQDVADQPEAKARWDAWVGDRPEDERPSRVPFDAKAQLGMLDDRGRPEDRSDYDVQLSSDAMVDKARQVWDSSVHEDGKSFAHRKYDFIDKDTVRDTFPALTSWKERWEADLGREVAPALFGSAGPPDKRADGKGISTHFRETDWIITRHGST